MTGVDWRAEVQRYVAIDDDHAAACAIVESLVRDLAVPGSPDFYRRVLDGAKIIVGTLE